MDNQGQTNFIIATGIDVTTQREAETTLIESEARYRQLVEGSLGMVCTHDLQGTLLSVNTHGAESLGRSVEWMRGKNLGAMIPVEHRAGMAKYLRKITETGEAQGRLHLSDKDGEVRVIAYRNKLIQLPEREPYVLGFGVDISEQVRAEEKLRALIHQSNSILESVGDGIYGLDMAGRVTVVNPAAAEMLGYQPDELLGRKLHELIQHTRPDGTAYPEEESHIMGAIRNLHMVRIANEVFWRKDGTSFPVEYVARPQVDSSDGDGRNPDKAIGVVVAFTDTTERQQLDRMKDEFISTVSHELRTPLTSLRAALGLVTGGALATQAGQDAADARDRHRQYRPADPAGERYSRHRTHLERQLGAAPRDVRGGCAAGTGDEPATGCGAEDKHQIPPERERRRGLGGPGPDPAGALEPDLECDQVLAVRRGDLADGEKTRRPGGAVRYSRPGPGDSGG